MRSGGSVFGGENWRGVPFAVRFLTLALLVGGGIGFLANFFLISGFWPWEMSPLAYRFLAAAAAAYVVGSLIVFARSRWAASEMLLATVIVYGVPLVGAVLMTPEVVLWDRVVAWLFIGIVTVALIISVFYVVRERRRVRLDGGIPLGGPLRSYLLLVGVLALVVGAVVFVAPKQSGLLWPWAPLDLWKPLDSRLIASMLLTVGGGALLAYRRNDRDAAMVFLPMLWAYCVVASVGVALHAAATPSFVFADSVYIAVFMVVVLVGAFLYPWERDQDIAPEAEKPNPQLSRR